ncbi:DNA-binding transcriptional regulator [Blastopirellula sp. J2-11]|uniref:AraC family transcriptional regulator n=1 Tax=Blastopirellula sp. J2-11 TaxID=2943192 RepID=UPI0021C6DCC4|nr:DNA-binding transcriptional regulator [Blastopirellula sp. J2-11]UUO06891.1 DNA-binding transcriptional regulator [Blastopirellula sp. J2-11]
MKRRKTVALLIETSNAYARGLLEGIISYVHEHQPWSIYVPEQERGASPPAWLKSWKGDGAIVRIETPQIAAVVKKLKMPVVDVSAAQLVPGVPWVETDDAEIARTAADHLLERGFREFAFCGEPHFNWSKWREENFVERLKQAKRRCHIFESTPRDSESYSWTREKRRMAAWLHKLPKPIGLMACYDIKGQQVLDICRELEIAVPEQVAVIGVDNDRLLCDLCSPPLSSVIPDARTTGYEAARLLDRQMNGETVGDEGMFVPPLGINTRQSTDVMATEDPIIAKAMQFIREHACDGVNVQDVLSVVPLSRRVLEYRFKEAAGKTPHEALVGVRLDRVRQLLRDTQLSMADIADRTGFEHVEYMSSAFRKKTGMSPSEYRRQVQPK